MSRNTKIILGVIAGLLVVCICGAGAVALLGGTLFSTISREVGLSVTSDEAEVDQAAARIADFDLPAGFGDPYTLDMMGMTFIGYTHSDNRSHIFLMQFPGDVDQSTMESQMEAMGSTPTGSLSGLKEIERRPVTIRGQEATLVVQEGQSSNDITYRQGLVFFQGKGGPAMLLYSRPASDWNEADLETFLASFQ